MATDTAAQGLRLLALAVQARRACAGKRCSFPTWSGFMLLALVGIIDPPREEAMRPWPSATTPASA
jgi:magnesium-transporting ATPase (P-type)